MISDHKGCCHKNKCGCDGHVVCLLQLSARIPGTLFVFSVSAQLHCITYRVDPLHAGEDQREDNRCGIFHPVHKFCFGRHLDSPCLLRIPNLMEIVLNIRDVTERNGYRISDVIADSDAVRPINCPSVSCSTVPTILDNPKMPSLSGFSP